PTWTTRGDGAQKRTGTPAVHLTVLGLAACARQRGQVDYCVYALGGSSQAFRIAELSDCDCYALCDELFCLARRSDQGADLVLTRTQRIDQMGPDEARCAGDEDASWRVSQTAFKVRGIVQKCNAYQYVCGLPQVASRRKLADHYQRRTGGEECRLWTKLRLPGGWSN